MRTESSNLTSQSRILLQQTRGHKVEIQKILFLLREQKMGRSFILSGPSGIGKKQVAWGLAQALTCEKQFPACGQCGSCLRAASHHSEHILFIEPEGLQLKVDQAQEVLSFLNLQSHGKRRCILIDESQQMNPAFANALLKTVEEPPPGTYFFFMTSNYTAMLSTLRSRSLHFVFHPVPEAELRSWANTRSEDIQPWMLEASRGSFGALQKLSQESSSELRSKAQEILVLLFQEKQHFLSLLWRDEFKDRAQSLEIVRFWQYFLRDLYFGKSDSVELRQVLQNTNSAFILKIWHELIQIETEILQQKDPVLLIEKLWSDFFNANN